MTRNESMKKIGNVMKWKTMARGAKVHVQSVQPGYPYNRKYRLVSRQHTRNTNGKKVG